MQNRPVLDARQRAILTHLNHKHSIETARNLAARLNVSERTVRSDIADINQKTESCGIRIESVKAKGFQLHIENRQSYLEIMAEKDNFMSKSDRMRTLLHFLVHQEDWYDLGDLEDETFVSRATLDKDLQEIRRNVSESYPFLKLHRRGNQVMLDRDEVKKRAILIRMYMEHWDYDSKEGILLTDDDVSDRTLNMVREAAKDLMVRHDFPMDDAAFVYLILAASIMFSRIQEGHTLSGEEMKDKMPGEITDADSYTDEFLHLLEDKTELRPSSQERNWLREIMEQLLLYSEKVDAAEVSRAYKESRAAALRFLQVIRDEYALDFTDDEELIYQLTCHIRIIRMVIISPRRSRHYSSEELRKKYPLYGDISHRFRMLLEKEFRQDLGRNEDDFLLSLFVSAKRRLYKKRRGDGVETLVFCHLNKGASGFFVEQLKKFFGDVICIKGVYPVNSSNWRMQQEARLIISTVRLKNISDHYRVPVLTLTPMVSREDRALVERSLLEIQAGYMFPRTAKPLPAYFPEELIYTDDSCESIGAVIHKCQQKMKDLGALSVLKPASEGNGYYAFLRNGVFMYYQNAEEGEQTVGSVISLKRELYWQTQHGSRAVIYLRIRKEDMKYIGWIYMAAEICAEEPELLEKVLESRTIEELFRYE